jgi:hypothetical protein
MTTSTVRVAAWVAVLGVTVMDTAAAQSLDAPLLDRLVGTWVLRGTIAGKPVVHDVMAQWVLGHQYIQIHETSRPGTVIASHAYDAIVYIGWNPDQQKYSCLWLDSTGGNGLIPTAFGHAPSNPAQLLFTWRGGDGEPTLTNTFDYDRATNTWRWTIDNVEKGKHRPFANVQLTRK